ncbi:DHHC palmitoyltransferase-domain-containing protein [Thamnocephalis sphaerospora]|uniref:Palmitoyltransferase n=1 Tax=Thamnocephalis sphaerospora TaxID=78915 RepID=A0A4V1IWW1_9FUNG|nr:DHHC palmitoyltransferase-domain-containing protein [Thamnocephalis sphaerospora]|eukprot:RKP08939.1 DHHC palmitoyltransferase-domain-containing protein [Thamnocephalis sphaerospora]
MNTDPIFVTGVWLLITFIVTTSQYFVFTKYLADVTVNSVAVYTVFNALCILLGINYYLAIRTDAGGVPPGWEPNSDAKVLEVKKSNAKPRYCRTCSERKPPRAHHCSTCQRCILKMDHHCPWIGNCVGHYNHGHFIRFLIYVDLATGMCLTVLGLRVYEIAADENALWYTSRSPDNAELLFLLLNLLAATIVFIMVGMLSIFHVWSVCGNVTTIENWENSKIDKMVRDGMLAKSEFPYNVGVYENLCQVLGPNPLLWLWPQRATDNGLEYPVAAHLCTCRAFIAWHDCLLLTSAPMQTQRYR